MSKYKKYTTESFIEACNTKHNFEWDYSNLIYDGILKPVDIICLEHGLFMQVASDHLKGSGCPICSKNKSKLTTSNFIERASLKHNNFYNYDNSYYIDSKTKVEINCPNHGSFLQLPIVHIRGQECPKCADEKRINFSRTDFSNKYKIGYLYIVNLQHGNEQFIKIGITGIANIKRRFCNISYYNMTILNSITDEADKIWNLEKFLHKNLKQFQYNPLFNFKGYTECFTLDVLNYIPELLQNNPIIKINESISN